MSDSPLFILLDAGAGLVRAAAGLAQRPLGFEPRVAGAASPSPRRPEAGEELLRQVEGERGAVFLLPFHPEFGIFEREALGETLALARRRVPGATFHHDDFDLGHPLAAETFTEAALGAFGGVKPSGGMGILLAAAGESDAGSRAQAYRLMRLLWERLGAARGETAFLRHPNPFLRETLERLTGGPLTWAAVPLMFEPGERLQHLRLILDDHIRNRPDAQGRFLLAEPPGAHPALASWAQQRMLALWQKKRQVETGRVRSAKAAAAEPAKRLSAGLDEGVVADLRDAAELRALLPEEILDAPVVFVKVTWHGYATGTYTDPAALDVLLEALPGKTVLLEGHTSSRNTAGAVDWDWETEAREHRAWIRTQESEFLEKTGLAGVIRRGAGAVRQRDRSFLGRRLRPAGQASGGPP